MTVVALAGARLGARLQALLDLCPVQGPVADIGSGHGRLAQELARRLPPGQVYATEAKSGPAAELRRLLDPMSRVRVLHGPGLTPLRQLGCRGAVIAGMGGRTIVGILEAELELARSLEWICLQPMQRLEPLTDWLAGQGCWAVRHTTVMERGRTYQSFLLVRR